MQDLIKDLLISLVSVPILWAFGELYHKTIRPWLASLLYRGIDVAGEWTRIVDDTTDEKIVSTFMLTQRGHDLSGIERQVATSAGHTTVEEFAITGEFRDGFISLSSTPKQKQRIGYLLLLLRLGQDGSTLKGQASWWDVRDERIASAHVELKRPSASLPR